MRREPAAPVGVAAILAAVLALAAALALGAAPAAAAEIAIETSAGLDRAYPLRGEPIRLTVTGDGGAPLAGAVVETVYRPNSKTGHTALLAPTDAAGTVTWTPLDAGIVTLVAHRDSAEGPAVASLNVAVRYGGFPPSGLAVMIVAGLVLFGGAAYGLVKLLAGEGAALPAAEPPST